MNGTQPVTSASFRASHRILASIPILFNSDNTMLSKDRVDPYRHPDFLDLNKNGKLDTVDQEYTIMAVEPALSIPFEKIRDHARTDDMAIVKNDRIQLVYLTAKEVSEAESGGGLDWKVEISRTFRVSDLVPKLLADVDPLMTPEALKSADWAIDTNTREFLIYQDSK